MKRRILVSGTGGKGGYNRHLRNQQIREYCKKHGKVLFDFADIESWHEGGMATSRYNGESFPREHDHYNRNEQAHTRPERTAKGKAWRFGGCWRESPAGTANSGVVRITGIEPGFERRP